MIDRVYKRCQEKGCKFLFSTCARQLIRHSNTGRVQGVICQDINGDYTKILAKKGAVLATGDYGSNKEMIAYYTPWATIFMSFWGSRDAWGRPTNTGDGQRMGVWVGAKTGGRPPCPHDPHHGWAAGVDAFFLCNNEANASSTRMWAASRYPAHSTASGRIRLADPPSTRMARADRPYGMFPTAVLTSASDPDKNPT